jgi:hypothetical protein
MSIFAHSITLFLRCILHLVNSFMFDMLIDTKGGTDPQKDRHDMNIIFFNVSEEPAASVLMMH